MREAVPKGFRSRYNAGMKATLTRRHFLAGSLAMVGTAAVAGCSGSNNATQTLYTIQAVVGIILTLKQLTRRSIVSVPAELAEPEFSPAVLVSLAPKAQTTSTATGALQSVNILADGIEMHLTGGAKALRVGYPYAIEPIVNVANDALAGGTLTILEISGSTIHFRVENAQVQSGAKVVPFTWESTATIN
jgi:hypothetical protein